MKSVICRNSESYTLSSHLSYIALVICFFSCHWNTKNIYESTDKDSPVSSLDSNLETAYFGAGCFWCVEAIFESIKGIEEVISGYSGGKKELAKYEQVSAGETNHAEAVEIYYDPNTIDFQTLVILFFDCHDPTTLNRQGPDVGKQYRSVIFYRNNTEKSIAEKYIQLMIDSSYFKDPITTTLEEFTTFYPAEKYHQNFEKQNPNHPYIQQISLPRLQKFKSKHPDKLK